MSLRLVMMGTGQFALPTFQRLYETPHQVVGLFTQPDRRGRGHHQRHHNPMKEVAVAHDTPVFQPQNVNRAEPLQELESLHPDLCVVAAYGQLLKPPLLNIPRFGAVNLHASLLPKYRGAAPVHWAVWNGETQTGVTVFKIEPKLDAGPILGLETTQIGPKETSGELEARLAEIAARLAERVIDQLERGTATPQPQNPAQATRAPKLKKADGQIDWSRAADAIECHVRAMQPWPKAFTFLQRQDGDLRLILLDADALDEEADAGSVRGDTQTDLQLPGTVVAAEAGRLSVQAGRGTVEIKHLRPEGKRAMSVAEFLHGHHVRPGDRLTSK